MIKGARRREIKERKCNNGCSTHTFCCPFKKNKFNSQIWKKTASGKKRIATIWAKSVTNSNEFWIRPYEGTFCKFISIHALGHGLGFGQHTHLPAPSPYQPHQRGKFTWRTWPYFYSKGREGFFLLVSHSQNLGLEPCCGAELFGDGASAFWHIPQVSVLPFWSCWGKWCSPPSLQRCCSLF